MAAGNPGARLGPVTGSYRFDTSDRARSVRLSDAERSAAMASLGRAFAEGRLTIDEYDTRCQDIAAAQFQGELEPLFLDLPHFQGPVGQEVDQLYSAQEIEAAHRDGRKTRAGVLGLTTVGALAGTGVLGAMASPFAAVLLFLIPVVWILLYVMKVGPAEWHVPSARAVDKQRIRELRTAEKLRAAELRLSEQDRLAELRAQRRVQTEELTTRALGFVNKAIEKRQK